MSAPTVTEMPAAEAGVGAGTLCGNLEVVRALRRLVPVAEER